MAMKNFVACLFVLAAASAVADPATKQAKLSELMQLQGLTEMIEQQQAYCQEQAKTIGPKLIAEFRKQIPELDEAFLKEVDAAYSAFVESAKPTWTVEQAVAAWGEYYGEQVTEDELDQIIAYYRSPIGQKDILATKQATPRWSAFFAERNQQVLESAMNEYVERLKALVQQARSRKSGA